MARRGLVTLVLTFLLTLTSCIGAARRGPGTLAAYEDMALLVDNNAWTDVTLYLVRSGTKTRLGRVRAVNEKTIGLPNLANAGTRWGVILQPTGTRGSRVYLDTDFDFPYYGYYRFLVRGEVLGPHDSVVGLRINDEMRMSHINMVR